MLKLHVKNQFCHENSGTACGRVRCLRRVGYSQSIIREFEMDEDEKIARARVQVAAITGFFIHLSLFAIVMVILGSVNFIDNKTVWVHWPFLGWGLGILGHAISVFGETPNFIKQWQSRKIKEIKQKL